MQDLPPAIRKYWYSIDWDVESLWRLDLPVEEIEFRELAWHLDVAVWPDEQGAPYTVTPRQVLEEADRHPTEHRRIQAASLDYPLEVFDHLGRTMILDGVHRLAKAKMAGLSTVRVRRVPEDAVARI